MAERPSPESWAAISTLLDEALDLSPTARGPWLANLRRRDARAAAAVDAWLDEYDVMQSGEFLQERPAGPPGLSSAALAGLDIGPYRLVAPIGQGGMGTVWAAERRDGQFDQRVAIKLLNAALMDTAASERFAREAAILARLTHPSISRLIDAGISSVGAPYLVLEHVDGEHIDVYCDRRRLDVTDRLYLFLDVLAPVAHAHANLIVHRDLKPGNVLVTTDGHVKLLDFGVAKLLSADADQPTVSVTRGTALTPAFAAPEQLLGRDVTTATDVYALGVVLFQLLTGRHPSVDGTATPAVLLDAVLRVDPPRPSAAAVMPARTGVDSAAERAALRSTTPERLASRLAGDLDTILGKALKKSPGERYPTVAALEDDLRRALRHEPISARPDTIRYRLAKFARRHRAPVAFAAAAFLSLTAGLVGTITQAQRATMQAARADREAADARAQRDVARRQLARAESINDLNAFLIADAAPVGRPFTARELLDRAERIITARPNDAAGTRIDSLTSLGSIYWDIGEPDKAVRVLRLAYDQAATHADASLRAKASCELGRALVKSGDVATTRALIDEGLARLDDQPYAALTRAICHLIGASAEDWAGDGVRALAHAERAKEIAQREGLTSPLFTLRIASILGNTYRMAGRLADADAAFSEAYAGAIALGRGDTESAGTLLNNWALVVLLLGRPLDAESMFTRSIAIASGHGSDTGVEPISWSNLARAVFELGRYEDSVRLAERALREAHARRDVAVADMAQQMLARALVATGRVSEGASLLADVLSRYRSKFPPSHPAFAAAALDEIRIARRRGELETALELADGAVQRLENDRVNRVAFHAALRLRSEIGLALARPDRALADAERLVTSTTASLAPDQTSSFAGQAYLALGEALVAHGRTSEAKAALADAVRHLEARAGKDHPQAERARTLLGRISVPGRSGSGQ